MDHPCKQNWFSEIKLQVGGGFNRDILDYVNATGAQCVLYVYKHPMKI